MPKKVLYPRCCLGICLHTHSKAQVRFFDLLAAKLRCIATTFPRTMPMAARDVLLSFDIGNEVPEFEVKEISQMELYI